MSERRVVVGRVASLSRRFQKRLVEANKTPWLMATGEGLRSPETEGGRPGLTTRLLHRYMEQVIAVAVQNPEVDHEFLKVTHLLEGPAALFRPRVVGSRQSVVFRRMGSKQLD